MHFFKIPLLLLTTLSACLTHAIAEKTDEQKPNIIFILSDDQRADSVGFMGNEVCQTPNLDKLASEGTVFDRAYVTSAICTPSRACYMLGQYERRHGINFNSGTAMSDEAWAKSYPVLIREAGYFTGYIGKNHLPIGDKGYFTGLMEKSFDYWYAGHHHIGFYPKEKHEIFDNAQADTQVEAVQEGIMAFLDPESNDAFIDKAVSFLSNRPQDQPFCLSIALNVPHGASTKTMEMRPEDPEIYRTLYRDQKDTLPLSKTYVPAAEVTEPKIPVDVLRSELKQDIYNYVNTPESEREMMVREYQTITGIDGLIGNLRAKLETLGLDKNTIIIYSSDHGIMQGEFGIGGKALCYEETLKVPMIIYNPTAPKAEHGKRSKALALSIDIAPTILDFAGAQIPDTVQGSSLRPVVDGQPENWRTSVFGENLWSNIFGNPRCETVRTADWRYIRYFENNNHEIRARTTEKMFYVNTREIKDNYTKHLTSTIKGEQPVYEELFFLAEDPHQEHNLANDPAHAKKLAELRAECQRLVAEAKGDVDALPSTIDIEHKWERTNYRVLNHN